MGRARPRRRGSAPPLEVPGEPEQRDRGAVLAMVAVGMVALLGFAAFGIDLGWLLLNGSRQQTAADAAALAAVVHLPSDAVTWEASTAYSTAIEVAGTNGYVAAEVSPQEVFTAGGNKIPNRVRVDVSRDVGTFFMRVFGIDTVSMRRTATAEFVPPLQLGSDDPLLGTFPKTAPPCDESGLPPGCIDPSDPSTWGGTNRGFWVAINAQFTAKEQGDPIMTQCLNSVSISSCVSGNGEHSSDGYYYGIDVPEGASSLTVELFDPTWWGGFDTSQAGAGDSLWFADGGTQTTFSLFAPDTTPFNPTDNSDLECSRTFPISGSGLGPGDPANFRPEVLCTLGGVAPGTHVLQVTAGPGHSTSNFSIRASTVGPAAAVFGIGRMSLFANQESLSPIFKLAKVTPVYAGRELTISLFDPGEAAGEAHVVFRGGAENLPCTIVVRRDNGSVEGPFAPAGTFGGAQCWIQSATGGGINALYNGDWLDFTFRVPEDYDCDAIGQSCWWTVQYVFTTGTVQDRTTWAASVRGTPIRLVLDQ